MTPSTQSDSRIEIVAKALWDQDEVGPRARSWDAAHALDHAEYRSRAAMLIALADEAQEGL